MNLTPRVKQYFAIYSSNDLELPTQTVMEAFSLKFLGIKKVWI
jgi:hypothetical protein